MLKKLRRLWAHKSIRKFLEEFLPKMGLGNLVKFECIDFEYGDYLIETSKGKYNMHFWELLYAAKEFHIDLCERSCGEFERITFSIDGNLRFRIIPSEFIINREGKRQVTKLLNGKTIIYSLVPQELDSDDNLCNNKLSVMKSEIADVSKLVRLTYEYI